MQIKPLGITTSVNPPNSVYAMYLIGLIHTHIFCRHTKTILNVGLGCFLILFSTEELYESEETRGSRIYGQKQIGETDLEEWKKKELIIACLKRLSIKAYHALMPLEDRMEDVKSAILPLYSKYSTSKHII